MEEPEDLYTILEVHPKASPEVIKKAYHALMQKNHPDRGGDLKLAKQINLAYDILIDETKRHNYDRLREQHYLRKMAQKIEADKRKKTEEIPEAFPEPPELKKLEGKYLSPMAWGKNILVSDERGKRVVILNNKGETLWTYGRKKGQVLAKPQLAHFSPDGHILVSDSSKQQVLKLNLKKQVVWQYNYQDQDMKIRSQAEPRFVQGLDNGNILLTDTGNRLVLEIDPQHRIVWKFDGKLAFSLSFQHQWIKPGQFLPVSAFLIDSERVLIADQGNGRVLEINRKGKLLNLYPSGKGEQLRALNFAYRMENGNTWICSDKIIEVNAKGTVIWQYKQLKDSDIKQAYPIEEGCFLLDFSHLVKRGINQEVMMVNQKNKILYRHYYSQYRFI